MAGRPRNNRPHIVDPAEVLNDAAIRTEIWRMSNLFKVTNDVNATIDWLTRHSLLKNSMHCSSCKVACNLFNYSQGVDGMRWCCPNCGIRKSIRDGSFFTRSHLPLSKIVTLMYCFSIDITQVQSKHEAQIQNATTVMDWFNFLRGDIGVFFERHVTQIGGLEDNGEPMVVEVGETQIFHKKYNIGTCCEGHWIFGGVERSTGKCFLVEVPDIKAETLENVIIQHVLPGTHIISNGLEGYKNLGQIADNIFMHSISVERNVMDPDVHTQTIENLFIRARQKLRKHCEASSIGTSFLSYLKEFQFRCNIQKLNVFNEILIVLKGQYPVEDTLDLEDI